MKISDEAVEAACKIVFGTVFVTHRQRKLMRDAIIAALTVDGYPKLLSETLAVMRATGLASDAGFLVVECGTELAATETYNELCRRVYHDGGTISGPGGLMGT